MILLLLYLAVQLVGHTAAASPLLGAGGSL